MTEYARTAIRGLSISGFRSIRSLELRDIPDLVVLHGPNGAGKSNLLLAAQLVLRAAALPGALPISREAATALSLVEADKMLGLRPDDFHFGVLPEIRIRIEVTLGTKVAAIVGAPHEQLPGLLTLQLVVRREGDGELQYWFERADIDGHLSLGPDTDPQRQQLRQELWHHRDQESTLRAALLSSETQMANLNTQPPSRQREAQYAQLRAQLQAYRQNLRQHVEGAQKLELRLGPSAFLAERIQSTLLPRLLQISPAYRVPGSSNDPEGALFQAFLSEDPLERQATQRLSRRLAKSRLFSVAAEAQGVSLLPVESATYKEKQVRLAHPSHGELPLRNLGSGEQQVVFMLAQRVITPFPIALLEEPEAHLHPSLMEPFAQVLLDSLSVEGGPADVDQLWIATHHHHFALALEYFDVNVVEGATTVSRLPRAKAARHFFEPGPIWEALRQLASSAKDRQAVVFRSADGRGVTAGEVLDSIEKDPEQELAKQYAHAMTEAMVLAMRQKAEAPK